MPRPADPRQQRSRRRWRPERAATSRLGEAHHPPVGRVRPVQAGRVENDLPRLALAGRQHRWAAGAAPRRVTMQDRARRSVQPVDAGRVDGDSPRLGLVVGKHFGRCVLAAREREDGRARSSCRRSICDGCRSRRSERAISPGSAFEWYNYPSGSTVNPHVAGVGSECGSSAAVLSSRCFARSRISAGSWLK